MPIIATPGIEPAVRAVIEREHEAAFAQVRERRASAPRERDALPTMDFRTSERHRTGYLAIGPNQGRFLFALALSRKARTIVEFGSSFGISTLYLAAAAKAAGGRVIGSEYHPHKAGKARANLSDAGLSEIAEIRVGDARETLLDAPAGIDLLFLDGAKDLYLPILERLEPKLAANALVVADNADHLDDDDPFLAHIGTGRYVTSRIAFAKGAMTLSVWMGEAS
ncbi:O-methyltransferase [Fulvimarina endophytica]|nr:class I SAM-dependent methyltransferase [Fulvimarina endophytica]